jgi:hypothetical protein
MLNIKLIRYLFTHRKGNHALVEIVTLDPIRDATIQDIATMQHMKLPRGMEWGIVQVKLGEQEIHFYRKAEMFESRNIKRQGIKIDNRNFLTWYRDRIKQCQT